MGVTFTVNRKDTPKLNESPVLLGEEKTVVCLFVHLFSLITTGTVGKTFV